MTAPIRTHVTIRLKAMRNPVIELRFVWIALCVGLADALGDHLWIALFVTHIFAVCALKANGIFEQLPTEGAAHDVVELLRNKLVTVQLVDIFLSLADGTFAIQTGIEWSPFSGFLGWSTSALIQSVKLRNIPKLNDSWIRPTGSSENHDSIQT